MMEEGKSKPYPFQRIGMALAFSPRAEALLHEARHLVEAFGAELVLIHVGEKSEGLEKRMQNLLDEARIDRGNCRVVWREGDPADTILEVANEEKVDLLLLGALRKEKLYAYYLGTIARKISRRARFSVLLFTEPSEEGQYFDKLVVNGLDHPKTRWTIDTAIYFAEHVGSRELRLIEEVPSSQVHVAIEDDKSRKEAFKVRQSLRQREHKRVEALLGELGEDPPFTIHQQCIFGRPGYTIGHYAEAEKADLLVLNSPDRSFGLFDRFFPHDIEYILSDMPTNVLIVHSEDELTEKEA